VFYGVGLSFYVLLHLTMMTAFPHVAKFNVYIYDLLIIILMIILSCF